MKSIILPLQRPLTLFVIVFLAGQLASQQNVGIGTTSPAATAILDVSSVNKGVLFPRMTSTERDAISSPAEGLMVYDTDESVIYIYRGSAWSSIGFSSFWTEDVVNGGIYYPGKVAIGDAEPFPFYTLYVSATGQVHAGRFENSVSSAYGSTTGVYGTASNSGSNNKIGGLFEALNGTGRKTGVAAWAFGNSGEIIGLYSYVTGAAPVKRAAWFGTGDVVVDEQLLVGSSDILDTPHESALLELRSTNKGLLLPRLSAGERMAISGATEGLIVFDTDSNQIFLHDMSNWVPLAEGGGGGGSGPWSTDEEGIHYDGGNVGVGGNANSYDRLYVPSGAENFVGAEFQALYNGSSNKYGIFTLATNTGTGKRYALYAQSTANPSDNSESYGLYGNVLQGVSPGPVYGVYGVVSGSGAGERWAGFFEGDAKVTEALIVGDKIEMLPTGYNSGSLLLMFDNDGTPTIRMHGNQTTSQGSEILMTDEAGTTTVVLDGQYASHGGGGLFMLRDENASNRVVIEAKETSTQGAAIHLYNADGIQSIELDADYGGSGDGRVITGELEITGGSDLAEYFSTTISDATIAPGSVVVIDTDNPGQIHLSKNAYDRKVVGVVSGANGIKPGMMMGQRESIAFGNVPVTIAGRAYVRTNNSGGKIEPGDMLTSSRSAGVAMKAKRNGKAKGAILGKALTRPDDEGFVLTLVLFQ